MRLDILVQHMVDILVFVASLLCFYAAFTKKIYVSTEPNIIISNKLDVFANNIYICL